MGELAREFSDEGVLTVDEDVADSRPRGLGEGEG